MSSQWTRKKPVEPPTKEQSIESCGREALGEGYRCYKPMDGTKLYVRYIYPYKIFKWNLLWKRALTFAGEVNSMLYYYRHELSAGDDTSKSFTLCQVSLAEDKCGLKDIRKIQTRKEIKFALQQPYFLELAEEAGTVESFDDCLDEWQLFLSCENVAYLKGLDSFAFFVWNKIVIIVSSSEEGNKTTATYGDDRQICKISLDNCLSSPTSVYCQDRIFYMICDSTLLIFKETLEFVKLEMSHPDCYIGGVDGRKLFINVPGLFYSYEVPAQEYQTMSMDSTNEPDNDKFEMIPEGAFTSKFLDEFSVVKIRGEGGCGSVFEVTNNIDRGEYAVKRVAVEPRSLERALREVRAMAKLTHPGIVRYNATWIEKPPEGWQHDADVGMLKKMGSQKRRLLNFNDDSIFIYIQMELCNHSLSDWLKDKDNRLPSTRNLPRMKAWFKQIVSAVAYIHEKGLIHRDLKPRNILFAERNVLKLCDLGIAIERSKEDTTASAITRTLLVGTPLYMSPEQRSSQPYSSTSDVFTLGLILAELCVVINDRTKVFDNYRCGNQCDLIQDDTVAKFVEKLTQVDPTSRPSCKEMLDDLFLA